MNYGVYNSAGDGPRKYWLTCGTDVVTKRMRQFKRAWWTTHEGAQRAADKLNAAIKLADNTLPGYSLYDRNNPPENGSGG